MLTFDGFSMINRMRCESPEGFNHALESWSLSDWITATTGELGEAANIAKKLNRIRDGIPGNPQVRICPKCQTTWRHDFIKVQKCSCGQELGDVTPTADPRIEAELRSALREEIADVFIYLDLLAQSQGFNLEAAVRDKFNKTSQKIGSQIEC